MEPPAHWRSKLSEFFDEIFWSYNPNVFPFEGDYVGMHCIKYLFSRIKIWNSEDYKTHYLKERKLLYKFKNGEFQLFNCIYLFILVEIQSHCVPQASLELFVAQDGLQLISLLPQTPEGWN